VDQLKSESAAPLSLKIAHHKARLAPSAKASVHIKGQRRVRRLRRRGAAVMGRTTSVSG
jgi:hypothetical protein